MFRPVPVWLRAFCRVPIFIGMSSLALTALRAQPALTWTLRHEREGGAALWGIADGNAGIVAVGTGGRILHSRDGVAWATRGAGTEVWLLAVTFGVGRYVAVGDRGTILGSTDGVNWTRRVSPTGVRLNNVWFAQDRFVAVGESGTVMLSLGGERWDMVDQQVKGWLRGLAFGNGSWMATGEGGVALTSLDGRRWTLHQAATTDLEAIAYSHDFNYTIIGTTVRIHSSYFRAVGAAGRAPFLRHSYRTVGEAVTEEDFYVTALATDIPGARNIRFRSIAIAPGLSVATGEDGSAFSASVPEFGWQRLDVGTRRNLVGSVFAQGSLFLVGEGETIYQSERIVPSRLTNLSTRGVAGLTPLIAGIRVVAPANREDTVLLRAAGPALGPLGVSGALADPMLDVFDEQGRVVATNAGWSTNTDERLGLRATAGTGAFPFAPGSGDAAVVMPVVPASYTLHVSSISGRPGTVLAEVYPRLGRVINVSARGQVGGGESTLIAGFVVVGESSLRLLVRGIGPGLAQFGVDGAVNDPALTLFDSAGVVVGTNQDWGERGTVRDALDTAEEVRRAGAAVGAFALTEGSRDAALLMSLVPGSYSVVLNGVGGSGEGLLEIYEVP
jgi:hypothetical protein